MSVMESREFSDAYGPMLPVWIGYGSTNRRIWVGLPKRRPACSWSPCRARRGVQIPQEGYLEALRRRCDEVGTLLIFDEIQTGFGRTGRCSPCRNTV